MEKIVHGRNRSLHWARHVRKSRLRTARPNNRSLRVARHWDINLVLRGSNHEEFSGRRAFGGVLEIVNRVGDDLPSNIHERGTGAGATGGAV